MTFSKTDPFMMSRIAVCMLPIILVTSCNRPTIDDPGIWSRPLEMARTADSLSASLSLYKWNDSLLAIGGDSGTFATRRLDENGSSWRILSTNSSDCVPLDADSKNNRIVVSRAVLQNDNLDVRLSAGLISQDGVRMAPPVLFGLDKAKLFGSADPNLKMSLSPKPVSITFAGGIVEGSEIRIPYSVKAVTVKGREYGEDTAANGLFASSDNGITWRTELVSRFYSRHSVIHRTAGFYYFIGVANPGPPFKLWYSRSPVLEGAWSSPEKLDKKLASNLSVSNVRASAEGNTLHLCWLDARNEKTRISLSRPRDENYEVAYSNRKDSGSNWSKDVILSKGLRWAYAPSMSVESNRIVVVWAGAKGGNKERNEWGPSDIYYATSKDGGKTWTSPRQVTEGFKSGITSGSPQVALHKGVIHLFYIQGKLNYKEVSSGMVKLNQPSWPIYYVQRPFPE